MSFTGNINGTSTINVFTVGSGVRNELGLAMERFILPASFQTQMLDRICLADNGRAAPNNAPPRLLLTGVTVAAIPEPSPLIVWYLIGIDVGGIGWWRKRKKT